MRVLLIGLSLTLVCFLAVKADDDADADAALDERDQGWVKRLEDEIDNIQVEEESDIDTEKREQGWKTYGKIKKGEEEVLELEKRQMNPSNKGFNKFGNGKFGGRFGKSRAGN
ncbi:uncharacterized protein LOC134824208 isoform X2 [Bolinopsis microptera]|uniref:uncharacterized protein LOC134824208 isoform X2 n=1 Tax=Bolinopsis microptera TaxID=2820187 RepID=UPI0030795E50